MPKERSSSTSSKRRLDVENNKINMINEALLHEDDMLDWDHFKRQIDFHVIPMDYVVVKRSLFCTFLLLEDLQHNCCLKASVTVSSDFTFVVHINRNEVSQKAFVHVLQQEDKLN